MKTKLFFRLLLSGFLLTLVSCKKEEKSSPEVGNEQNAEQFFKIEIDAMAEKDDNFAVYYTEDNSTNFTGDQAEWSGITGGNKMQTLFFKLKNEAVPTDIRLDFGIDKTQGDVTVSRVKFEYAGKKFETKGSELLKYFINNDSVKTQIDQTKGTITFLKNPKGFQPPFYYPHQAILDEIEKITH